MKNVLKRPLSILLAALMVMSLFVAVPITASANVGDFVPESEYLTFTAEEDNSSVTLRVSTGSNLQYNKNNSVWQSYTAGSQIDLENEGDSVRFRGKNTTFDSSNHVSIDGKVACSGNVMSLRLDDDGMSQGLSNSCFSCMFMECAGLTAAPELPETTLAENCYERMFYVCTNLTAAPELPATALAPFCYYYMFAGCGRLTTAPELWATSLANNCYSAMFLGCEGLTTAPQLPATTLARNCYERMFYHCTGLTTAPELPATTLERGCYSRMFMACSKIKLSETQTAEYSIPYRVPSGGNGTTATGALDYMFASTGGTFAGTPEIDKTYYLYREVPKYTVTWKNGDTVIETDTGVAEGSTPTYDGTTPVKTDDSNNIYTFSGWTPAVSAVTGDVTYTATFTSTPAVAKIGDAKYATLQDALDYVPNGGTVTVLKNITSAGTLFADGYVSGGNRTYTVDLGGYTVSGATFIVDNGNNVTFKNGTITSASNAIQNKATATVDSTATVKSTSATTFAVFGAAGSTTNINGTVEGKKAGVSVTGATLNVSGSVTATDSADGRAITAKDGSTVNLNNGADVEGLFGVVVLKNSTVNVNEGAEVSATGKGISGNGSSADAGYTINVNGGTVSGDSVGIFHPNSGNLTISGGTISGATAVYTKSGSTTITGGTLNGTGAKADYAYNGNGAYPTGDALVVDNCAYPGGAPNVTISGGTFNSANGVQIGSYNGNTATELASVKAESNNITIADDEKWVENTTTGGYDLVKKDLQDYADETVTGGITGLSFVDSNITENFTNAFKASLLGVQLRKNNVEYEDTYGSNDLRYVAAVEKTFLAGLDDYGFAFSKDGTHYTEVSCKGTENTVITAGQDDDYTYFTAALKNISETDQKLRVKFYVKDGNDTAYAKYTKTNPDDPHQIIASYNDVVTLANGN